MQLWVVGRAVASCRLCVRQLVEARLPPGVDNAAAPLLLLLLLLLLLCVCSLHAGCIPYHNRGHFYNCYSRLYRLLLQKAKQAP